MMHCSDTTGQWGCPTCESADMIKGLESRLVALETELLEMAAAYISLVHRIDACDGKRIQYDEWLMCETASEVIVRLEADKEKKGGRDV